MKYFVRFSLNALVMDEQIDGETQIAKNFKLKELANTLGDSSKPQYVITPQTVTFMKCLQDFRDTYNKSMTITSCYRQPAFNKKVGGDPSSAHLIGCAVDWKTGKQSSSQRANVASMWKDICTKNGIVGAINYYTNGYHLEMFSDICYGSKSFKIRDYRGRTGDW